MRALMLLICVLCSTLVLPVLQADESSVQSPIMQGIAKIDSILATVDGVPVTLRDVILESMYYERKLTGMYSGERLYNEILKVRKTILDDIIFRHIVYNKYLKNPFEIPKQEIDRRMDIYYERIGAKNRVEFEQRAAKYGITTDELRGKVREEFAVEVIIQQNCFRGITITPKHVYEEYTANPDKWSDPEQVWLQMIQVRFNGSKNGSNTDKVIKKISSLLKHADARQFKEVQAEYSDLIDSLDALPVNVDSLRPEFREVLKEKKSGFVSGPIKTVEGIYFLRVDKWWSPRRKAFPAVSLEIMNELREKAGKQKLDEFRKDLESAAIIKYLF